MSDGVGASLNRMARRVLLMIGRGRVTTSNDAGPVQTLQMRLGANEVLDSVPCLYAYGFTGRPVVGSDGILAFIAGDRSNPIVIATGNQADRIRNLAEGECALYHHDGKFVHLTNDGIVIDAKHQPVTINNATVVTVHAESVSIVSSGTVSITGSSIHLNG